MAMAHGGSRGSLAGLHWLALGFLCAVLVIWAGIFGLTLRRAELPPEAGGRVVAIYPFGWSGEQSIAAALQTEARLVRETWLPNAIELTSEDAGFAARLRAAGAIGVYRAQPFDVFTLAGCTGMPPARPAAGPNSLRRLS
jgi:hypothetical protein